jgi:hypothetical protein
MNQILGMEKNKICASSFGTIARKAAILIRALVNKQLLTFLGFTVSISTENSCKREHEIFPLLQARTISFPSHYSFNASLLTYRV